MPTAFGRMETAGTPDRFLISPAALSVPFVHEARSLVLDVPRWEGHRAGQHVDVRLTAEDGYQAQRSYSIASAPEEDRLVLTVDRLDDGEVSPYLTDVLTMGDSLELRGPIAGPRPRARQDRTFRSNGRLDHGRTQA